MKRTLRHLGWIILWMVFLSGCLAPFGSVTIVALVSGIVLWRSALWRECRMMPPASPLKLGILAHIRTVWKWSLVWAVLAFLIALSDGTMSQQQITIIAQTSLLFLVPATTGIDIPFRHLRSRDTLGIVSSSPSPWSLIHFGAVVALALIGSFMTRPDATTQSGLDAVRHEVNSSAILHETEGSQKSSIPLEFRTAKHFAYIYSTPTEEGLLAAFASDFPGIAEHNAQLFASLLNQNQYGLVACFTRTEPIGLDQTGPAVLSGKEPALLYKNPGDGGLICICVGTTAEHALRIASQFRDLYKGKYGRELIVARSPLPAE